MLGRSLKEKKLLAYAVYFFPLLSIVEVNFLGRLSGADIGCLAIVAANVVQPSIFFKNRFELKFYMLAILWLLSLVLTDLYLGTPFEQYARGWARVAFFIINFAAVRLLVGQSVVRAVDMIFVFFLAAAIKQALGIGEGAIAGSIFGSAWKFGYGQLFTFSALWISSKLILKSNRSALGVLAPFAAAFVNLFLDARNLFGRALLSALAVVISVSTRRPFGFQTMIAVMAFGIIFGLASVSVYSVAASGGLLGKAAQEKYENQTQGQFGILLGGRSEILASSQAVVDSPIIGHGSWARDKYYATLLIQRLRNSGRDESEVVRDTLIPTHSYLMVAWVEAGILGAVFWIWALWVCFRALYSAIQIHTAYAGIFVYVSISLVWGIFFSPFGLDQRFVVALWLCLLSLVPGYGSGRTSKVD
tara:strand:- start:7884 stop:9134 length:1251 start_codon:yes stop_codon:yes gene_type:complete